MNRPEGGGLLGRKGYLRTGCGLYKTGILDSSDQESGGDYEWESWAESNWGAIWLHLVIERIKAIGMKTTAVSAEIKPMPHRAPEAALALQKLGFRIHHYGESISIGGSKALWKAVFNISFNVQKKRPGAGLEDADMPYEAAFLGEMRLPEALKPLIEEILFIEPPTLF